MSFSAFAVPQGASVPTLGLSNKAVYEGHEVPPEERHIKDEYPEFYFTPLNLKGTLKCHICIFVLLSLLLLYRFIAGICILHPLYDCALSVTSLPFIFFVIFFTSLHI
jgi:hypothetical protein